MPMTWTYAPGSGGAFASIYDLRLLLQDTDVEPMAANPPRGRWTCMFSDEELARLFTMPMVAGDLVYAWSWALKSIASSGAKQAVFVQLNGGGSVNYTSLADKLMALSKQVLEDYITTYVPGSEAYVSVDNNDFNLRQIYRNAIPQSTP